MTGSFAGATCLGANHGYRFDGDFVHLNAELSFSDADLSQGTALALQLWSSAAGFAEGLNGIKVAELAVEPRSGGVVIDGLCAAMPPAGTCEQTMGLALVAFVDGVPQLRDLTVYPARQGFFQPSLIGNVSCMLKGGEAELMVEAITNPRAIDNLSGTLSLEVWALDAPYTGGSWCGVPVASLVLGMLGGGSAWTNSHFCVPAALPAQGAALTVMLREWTPAGYVTRDYRNFPGAAAATAVSVEAPAPVVSETSLDERAVPVKPAAKTATPAKKAGGKSVAVKAEAKSKPVSLNKASEAELLAVKGLSAGLARAIIAARPYAKLEDVCKAKGMGPKMLAKLRDQFVL